MPDFKAFTFDEMALYGAAAAASYNTGAATSWPTYQSTQVARWPPVAAATSGTTAKQPFSDSSPTPAAAVIG